MRSTSVRYLLALSGLSGTVNLVADSLFLVFTLVALRQVGARMKPSSPPVRD